MGRQVCIRTLPGDLGWLEGALRERGALFVAYRHGGPEPETRSTISWEGNPDPIVWLVRGEDLASILIRRVKAQGYWVVDQLRSPVVELSRRMAVVAGARSAEEPVQGRLFYELGYHGDSDGPVEFPGEFVEWAQGIFKTVRGHFTRDPGAGCYDGPDAHEWFASHPHRRQRTDLDGAGPAG